LDEEGYQDEDSFDPAGFGLDNHAWDNAEDSEDRHDQKDAVVY